MIHRIEMRNTNRPIRTLAHWHENGDLLIDPPYQRGDVWGPIRRANLIRSILQGIPIPSIIINDRHTAKWPNSTQYAVIDGRQRVTTILMFLRGDLVVPALWFGLNLSHGISYSDLSETTQRGISNSTIGICEGTLPTIEDEQDVFELVNFGGVPQGMSDIEGCLK